MLEAFPRSGLPASAELCLVSVWALVRETLKPQSGEAPEFRCRAALAAAA